MLLPTFNDEPFIVISFDTVIVSQTSLDFRPYACQITGMPP